MTMTISQMQRARRILGYSYKDLAERSGVPLSTVQKVFGGVTASPRMETLIALERVLAYPEDLPLPEKYERNAEKTNEKEYPVRSEPGRNTDMVCEPSVQYGAAVEQKRQGEYTIDDYLALPDDVRYELIDGVLIKMDGPTSIHQRIAGFLYHKIYSYIDSKDGSCIPYIAPLDVQLDEDNRTMVQPDVIILCSPEKDIEKRLFGAPDFVAEVLSPSTWNKDMVLKLSKYMNAGVREYWIIDPKNRRVLTYWFGRGEAEIGFASYTMTEDIPLRLYDGDCVINFSSLMEQLDRMQPS